MVGIREGVESDRYLGIGTGMRLEWDKLVNTSNTGGSLQSARPAKVSPKFTYFSFAKRGARAVKNWVPDDC
jgi:hypothetical protein